MDNQIYNACRCFISSIDSISSNAKIIIDNIKSYNNDTDSSAKLFIHSKCSNTENILTEDEVNLVISMILKKYKKSIEQYQKELNECINEEVLKIAEVLKDMDDKSEQMKQSQ